MTLPSKEVELWCHGLLATEVRRLTDSEVQSLLRKRFHQRIQAWAYLLSSVFQILGPIVLRITLQPAAGTKLKLFIHAWLIVALALWTPAFLLMARDRFRRIRLLNQDLADPQVATFEMPAQGEIPSRTFSLLRASGLVYASSFRWRKPWLPWEISEVALKPTDPISAPVPQDWLADPSQQIRRRHLTALEKLELERHLKALRARRMAVAVFLTALGCMGIPGFLDDYRTFFRSYGIGFIAVAAIAAFEWLKIIKNHRAAGALAQDLELGWVAIRSETLVRLDEGRRTEVILLIESLPTSGTVWTIGDERASWRYGKFARPTKRRY